MMEVKTEEAVERKERRSDAIGSKGVISEENLDEVSGPHQVHQYSMPSGRPSLNRPVSQSRDGHPKRRHY